MEKTNNNLAEDITITDRLIHLEECLGMATKLKDSGDVEQMVDWLLELANDSASLAREVEDVYSEIEEDVRIVGGRDE